MIRPPATDSPSASDAACSQRLQQLEVLFLLEQDAQEGQLAYEPFASHPGPHEHCDPVDEFARRRALANPWDRTKLVKGDHRLIDEGVFDLGMVHAHDALHSLLVREVEEVKD